MNINLKVNHTYIFFGSCPEMDIMPEQSSQARVGLYCYFLSWLNLAARSS
jgi:hypothetical protein